MSQQNNVESRTQPLGIEDLAVDEVQTKDVKGGSTIYIHDYSIKGDVTTKGWEK